MPRPSPLTYLPLWTRALDVEIGIRFEVAGIDRQQFANVLYQARQLSNDARLQDLMLFQPAAPFDNEVWVCKKQVELSE